MSRQLDSTEFAQALREKLLEETQELATATDRNNILEEVVDLYHVIQAIMALNAISPDEFKAASDNKLIERGGFEDQLYIERVTRNPDNYWYDYYLDNSKYPIISE